MPKKRIWTEEQKNQIVDWYIKDGFSISYIAKKLLKCRSNSVSNILKEKNIKIRNNSAGRVININDEKDIIYLYTVKRYTQKQIAEKFNCSTFVVHGVLIRNGIEIINQPRININQDETYFDIIDTEHKAYWLGFIFADGNIYKNQLSIEINEKDILLLEQFKKDLKLNSKISIRHRKNTDMCCVRMVSAHLCESLSKYGIVENKTERTKHLPKIEEKLLPHFLRGLIDGDGWITKDKKGNYHIGFVTNHFSVCEDFKTYCNVILNGQATAKITYKDKDKHPCFQIQSQKNVKQLATALYKDNTICLSRKYRLVEPLFDFKNDEDIV